MRTSAHDFSEKNRDVRDVPFITPCVCYIYIAVILKTRPQKAKPGSCSIFRPPNRTFGKAFQGSVDQKLIDNA